MVRAVDVSPDGKTIASGSRDKTVRVWDVETELLLHTLEGHEADVHSVHISPNSKRVASGSWDGALQVWDIKTGELAFKPIKCNGQVLHVRFSPGGDRIASAHVLTAAAGIQIWNADTAQCILSIKDEAYSVAWSLNGEQLISGGWKHITIWDSLSGQQIRTWQAHDHWVYSLLLSRNGSHLATCSTNDTTAFVFNVTTGEQIAAYKHNNNLNGLAYSPSGRFILAACVDKKAYLWDAPEEPQATSPVISPLDLPAVAPQGEHSESSEQQGYEYTDFLDLSATARPPDHSISRHQPTSSTPRRPLNRFKDAITRQLNRTEGSRAGGEEAGRGPLWWKRVQLRVADQTPPVDNDQPNPQNPFTGIFDHTQTPSENDERESGSSRARDRTTRPQHVQVAAGRDKAVRQMY
ncbi:hypothetical protein HYDPIDRAFT_111454 [Hydnomerulius pinastri MD-312]|uniref:Anaphase-promoting complex subunit 4 WD40 domain-containing protein n=1 Tax=Hydnomerulius pinastri MD-312 TaxID=994086 RepID=A0A0C9VGV7_9AGAM|nr:hypothetical protein HYDPIDRAFT_111454 [Hydnomerulius pinastri MD-312]